MDVWEDRGLVLVPRLLQSNATNSTIEQQNDGQVLRDTFLVYGLMFLVLFGSFCVARQYFPKPYTIRRWQTTLRTHLAENQHGWVSWAYKLTLIADDEMLHECGMDALCFIRVLRMGFKVSLVGILNAIWLLPLYATAKESPETSYITVGVLEITIAHVPSGSLRLVGTAVAAYILFFYTMYLILQEFQWFVDMRHKFLKQPLPRNYAVFVRNVPEDYRTDATLHNFFDNGFAVEEANLRVKAPTLAAAVTKRRKVAAELEHALAVKRLTGEAPVLHHSFRSLGHSSDMITTKAEQLKAANADISARIDQIRSSGLVHEVKNDVEQQGSDALLVDPELRESPNGSHTEALSLESGTAPDATGKHELGALLKPVSETLGQLKQAVKVATGLPIGAASMAVNILKKDEDGDSMSGGFVSFKKLRSVHACLQMIQHETPYSMEVMEAPEPDDVFWPNVGRTHKDLQVGWLLSLGATGALCLLWTVPMAFIASLSSVQGLRDQVPFIDQLLNLAPWLDPVLEQLAPLLVKVVNALLPIFLRILSMLEGPVSGAVVEASLFTKLSYFMVVQTFFVSAISGGILQEVTNILNNPTEIVNLLANSLPSQATYFMQIVFVGTVVMVGIELLRTTPIIIAIVRRYIGPRLTEKERNKKFFILRPLSDPTEFEHADLLSQVVLHFTVQLVYAVIAPITSIVLAFCFLYMGSAYRHQFVFIYPTKPDSGGKLWTHFIKILIGCMLIAELTIVGLLVLKKSTIAIPLMVPLIVITVLFSVYIRQEHFRVAEFLPARACMKADIANGDHFDLSFLKDTYLQPELQEKEVLPEVEDDQELPLVLRSPIHGYDTPDQSERASQAASESLDIDNFDTNESAETSTIASMLAEMSFFRTRTSDASSRVA